MNKQNHRQALINKMEGIIEQKEITCHEVNTSYLTSGSGPPVLLLHGAGAGSVTWYPSLGTIAKNFTVFAPDIVGYGESDKPDAPYDKHYFSEWLKSFLSVLALPKVSIVGLSQGGAIALQFVIDYPDLVEKLVLVNSGGLGAKPSLGAMAGMLWMNCLPSQCASDFNEKYLLYNKNNRDPNHRDYSIEVLKSPSGKKAFTRGKGTAVSAIPQALLCRIKKPTLILWGEEDKLFLVKHGEAAAELIPNAKLVRLPQAGHLCLMDQPKVFNTILCDYLLDRQIFTKS